MRHSILLLALVLFTSSGFANDCPRCRIIESERAEKGAQSTGYYDVEHPEAFQKSESTNIPAVQMRNPPKNSMNSNAQNSQNSSRQPNYEQ